MNALNTKIPPPIVALLLALLMGWLAGWATGFFVLPHWTAWLAVPVLCVGLVFDVFGIIQFIRNKTTINPLSPQKSSVLVTHGIYRITRNPMYVGMALTLTAWALYLQSIPALIGPVIFASYITRFQIKPEEDHLLQIFGEPYRNYLQEVRRWL
ncbi:methyltransferase family protein [Amphibiibacter pelophylacis]|uniref:Isoprenylcysteine carboxylmethyltransferase family protein n=1 Tax=Amphibiibacter pelophylacis TaxID=1799477 RepID=A0ACC6P3F0_9BURK